MAMETGGFHGDILKIPYIDRPAGHLIASNYHILDIEYTILTHLLNYHSISYISISMCNGFVVAYVRSLCLTQWSQRFQGHPYMSRGRLNKKDGLTRYGDSHVKDKTS